MIRICLAALLLGGAVAVAAEDSDKKLSIGDLAPAWEKLPGVDGKQHSLGDLKDKELVVVVFTCNSCPVANDYEDRIIAFAKQYAGPEDKVALVAINVNKIDEDKFPKMQERAKAKGFPFPYLYDESQQIAKAYGAVFTPEFFVLNKERKLIYTGAMDDASNPASVKVKYLEPAVVAALKGEPPANAKTSAAAGCMIRYVRERRKPQVK